MKYASARLAKCFRLRLRGTSPAESFGPQASTKMENDGSSRLAFRKVTITGAASPAKIWSGKRADTIKSRSDDLAATPPTNNVELSKAKTRNRRLLPVFQAA